MRTLTAVTVRNATQAKLIISPQGAIVKVPGNIPVEMQKEVRNKLIKIADLNQKKRGYLKLYYKIGTPYLFLNRKFSGQRKQTEKVYKYADL
jgi:hypothetical protein